MPPTPETETRQGTRAPWRPRAWLGLVSLLAGALAAVLTLTLGIAARTVWLASVRETVVATAGAVSAAAVILLAVRLGAGASCGRGRRAVVAGVLVLWVASLAAILVPELRFRSQRDDVLGTPARDLRSVGRHVMVGYRDEAEVRALIRAGAIGGIFVTARNAAGKSVATLAAEIEGLQALARANGHGRLIVATDQEGGFVSRLSPPLPRPRMLAELGQTSTEPEVRAAAVQRHGLEVGRHLASVGVTLNFAPVVDLDFGIRDPADRQSRIGERAIGREPGLVAEVAGAYCAGLAAAGVLCTLKHFPGLGRVHGDTHVTSASLVASVPALEADDWRPYREIFGGGIAAVMVGHVVATALDASRPASASAAVIGGALRAGLGFDGLVVTDDLTMVAASGGAGGVGVGAAGVAALVAGADLLLVAYDTDQVYALVDALLAARLDGRIGDEVVAVSARRIARVVGGPAE